MDRKSILFGFCLVALAGSATAQTVTGSGTTNTVPVFTGTSTVGNSPISVSGSNVGIGTTNPETLLNVSNPNSNPASMIFAQETPGSINGSIGVGSAITSGHAGFLVWDDGASPYLSLESFSGGSPVQIKGSQLWLNPTGGNVGIGTSNPGTKLEVNGNVKLTSGSGGSITFADGSVQSTAYTGVLCGGDYAESIDVTGNRADYEPGDVLVLDPETPGKFSKARETYSSNVAGVFSTRPGLTGRRQSTPRSPDEIPVAVVGIVPIKVSDESGPIRIGDLLVTSSRPGYSMKGTDRSRMLGAVVGKAMGSLDSGTGVIEVLVTLQ